MNNQLLSACDKLTEILDIFIFAFYSLPSLSFLFQLRKQMPF